MTSDFLPTRIEHADVEFGTEQHEAYMGVETVEEELALGALLGSGSVAQAEQAKRLHAGA